MDRPEDTTESERYSTNPKLLKRGALRCHLCQSVWRARLQAVVLRKHRMEGLTAERQEAGGGRARSCRNKYAVARVHIVVLCGSSGILMMSL